MMYPKPEKKKKARMRHPQSILHEKDGTCYLCVLLEGNHEKHAYVEEHHVFGGNPNRRLSEEYGMKVYLCLRHHREGKEAVHNDHENMRRLQQEGQRAFEEAYPGLSFREIFGKDYLMR